MSEKDFKFYIPVDFTKSEASDDEAEDSWKIGGIASTGDLDYQGEMVDQEGLDLSVLKAGRGLFNNNHEKGPENILGQIEDADLITIDDKKVMIVKGYLFKHQPRAQAYYNIMKSLKKGSPSRVHFSIEGKILARGSDSSQIKKARITKVAITMDPVNPYTLADLCKSLKEADEVEITAADQPIEKAMEAGTGSDKAPADMKGGEVYGKESLDMDLINVGAKKLKKNKKIAEQVIKSNIATLVTQFPEANPLVLAELVCKSYEKRIKESK